MSHLSDVFVLLFTTSIGLAVVGKIVSRMPGEAEISLLATPWGLSSKDKVQGRGLDILRIP